MADELKVDYEELENAIKQMKTAYNDFKSFSKSGFSSEIKYLDQMNSDFVDKLTRVLEISKKWNLDSLRENIGNYIKDADVICKEIKEMDEALTKVE